MTDGPAFAPDRESAAGDVTEDVQRERARLAAVVSATARKPVTWFCRLRTAQLAASRARTRRRRRSSACRPRSPSRSRRSSASPGRVVQAVVRGAARNATRFVRTVIAPITPAGPAAPAGPAGRRPRTCGRPELSGCEVRARSERFRTFAGDRVVLIFGFVTAPNFSCAGPTLFLASGSPRRRSCLSATSSARHATTIAGDGRRIESLRIRTSCQGVCATRHQDPSESSQAHRVLTHPSRGDRHGDSTDSKYSPPRRPVRRFTWRSSRSTSRSPRARRISG